MSRMTDEPVMQFKARVSACVKHQDDSWDSQCLHCKVAELELKLAEYKLHPTVQITNCCNRLTALREGLGTLIEIWERDDSFVAARCAAHVKMLLKKTAPDVADVNP